MSETQEAHFTRSRSRSRSRSAPAAKRARLEPRGRSVSRPARDTEGVGDKLVSSRTPPPCNARCADRLRLLTLSTDVLRYSMVYIGK